jgi:hypothetical protein
MTQKEVVLNHLKSHTGITSMEAYSEYKITRLADVVFRLKKDGHKISSLDRTTETQYGPTKFVEYRLVKEI